MVQNDQNDTMVGISPAAMYLGVSVKTIIRWGEAGILPVHFTHGKHRRYKLKDLQKFRDKSDKKGKK